VNRCQQPQPITGIGDPHSTSLALKEFTAGPRVPAMLSAANAEAGKGSTGQRQRKAQSRQESDETKIVCDSLLPVVLSLPVLGQKK